MCFISLTSTFMWIKIILSILIIIHTNKFEYVFLSVLKSFGYSHQTNGDRINLSN